QLAQVIDGLHQRLHVARRCRALEVIGEMRPGLTDGARQPALFLLDALALREQRGDHRLGRELAVRRETTDLTDAALSRHTDLHQPVADGARETRQLLEY